MIVGSFFLMHVRLKKLIVLLVLIVLILGVVTVAVEAR